jgi:hypothetical protein
MGTVAEMIRATFFSWQLIQVTSSTRILCGRDGWFHPRRKIEVEE